MKTREERAKELFLKYNGNRFYMDREGDGSEYEGYHIPKETEELWAKEFIFGFLKTELKGREALRAYSTAAELLKRDRMGDRWEQCLFYPLRAKNGFRIEEDILDHITSDINLVMIAEPNNPTGLTAGRALLRKILHKCEEADAVLVVDESFLDFCYPYQSTTFKTVTVKNSVVRNILSDPDGYRILNPDSMLYSRIRPDEAGRLLVLRSLTKICALAGIRLGFACSSNPALLAVIGQAGAPWSVSAPAQAAGLAAVSESFLPPDQLSIISSERERVLHDLRGLGMEVLPGEANFLLFYCKRHELADRLAEQGILIRSCRNFRGLGEGWFRTARRLPEENDRLLQARKRMTVFCRPWKRSWPLIDSFTCREVRNGKIHYDPGDHVQCGQEPALRCLMQDL